MCEPAATIDRINEILLHHTEIEALSFVRSRYAYDAKLMLRGRGTVLLRIRQVGLLHPSGLSLHQMQLRVQDVRDEQHDRVNYEIENLIEDHPLLRCRSLTLAARGERLELR